ncbi:MAG TPA: DUF4331 family protein [Chitinophagaceae bacterium]|nr:DUF4331 family protein [Chitinophagaceae bacterium]
MLRINKHYLLALFAIVSLGATSCDKDDVDDNFDTSGTYIQNDQMARPAINTVFVGSARKNEFNTTAPSAMSAAFTAQFLSVLTGFGYSSNALGMDKATFAGALVTDVLNVKMNGPTTFFDGTNVLTGRALADDVIDTELLLIFGGASGGSNPGLTRDNVNANDKSFLSVFPYLAAPF